MRNFSREFSEYMPSQSQMNSTYDGPELYCASTPFMRLWMNLWESVKNAVE